jgi:hypothetical protein
MRAARLRRAAQPRAANTSPNASPASFQRRRPVRAQQQLGVVDQPVRLLDGREPARQLHGQEHLGPAIDRAIGGGTQHDVQRQIEPQRLRRHAQRVLAQRLTAGRTRARLQPPVRDAIDGITHARRAVVEEVVVFVRALGGPRVVIQRRLQRLLLGLRQPQLLHRDAAVFARVRADHAWQ